MKTNLLIYIFAIFAGVFYTLKNEHVRSLLTIKQALIGCLIGALVFCIVELAYYLIKKGKK